MEFPCRSLLITLISFLLILITYATETCYDGVAVELTALDANNTFLETPGYPHAYPNGFSCGALITAERVNGLVKLQVWNSSLASQSSSCTSDYAEIFDGLDPSYPLLTRWCGYSRPAVTSTGRYAFFRFVTNGSLTDEGIRLEFTSGTLGIIPVEVTTTQAPATTTTEASSAGAIAGGVIGGLLGVAIIVGAIILIVFCVKKHKGKITSEKNPQKNSTNDKKEDRTSSSHEDTKTNRVFSRPVSQREASLIASERESGRSTSLSFIDSPGTMTPAFSPTPPRTPKGSVRFVESRLRLNSDNISRATPPPSHREALRSSAITIASINTLRSSKSGHIDEMGIPLSPLIPENPTE